ncbi:MAG: hypothetical protein K0S65_6400, partial [Labilithrix sp.]|nr:hypothetical protein [Labilithrix sp.]
RHHSVDAVPAPSLDNGRDVEEVNDLTDVGDREARRVAVPVDRDDPHAQLPKAHERAALMAARADEEDSRIPERTISAPYHL